jgi:tetratricopeptide (TPR) repeat protein
MKRSAEVLIVLVGCALVYSRLSAPPQPPAPTPRPTHNQPCPHHYQDREAHRLFVTGAEQEDLKAAERQLLEAIRLEPANPAGPYHLGHVYFEQKRYQDCIAATSRALEHRPGLASALNLRAYARAQLNSAAEWKLGLADANLALQLEQEPTYYDTRGVLLHKLGQPNQALTDFDMAVSRDPRKEHLTHRADLLQSLGRTSQADADRVRAALAPN